MKFKAKVLQPIRRKATPLIALLASEFCGHPPTEGRVYLQKLMSVEDK
jgi:hypothetical protein